MKKRKFNILLNIAVLCMCVCAIAIGVYSAKTASLNVSGTIGFTAHNCKVRVLGKITGAMDANNVALDPATTPALKYQESENKGKLIDGTADTWSFGSIYFDDLNTDKNHEVNDIVFTFTITNESAYHVDVTVNQDCINNNRILIYAPNNGETLSPQGQEGSSVTLTVKLQLQKVNGEYSSLNSAISLSNATLLNFTKSQAPSYLATNWRDKITDIYSVKSISFVNVVDESIKSNDSYTQINVGAENATSNQSDLTSNTSVTDVVAYYNSTSKEVIVYSPARIYAPQNCREMFAGLTVSSLDVSNFDTSKVTNMGSMFSLFSATSLNLSNFDTSNVTNMSSMFYCCGSLTSLDLSNFDTSNVTNMSGMFVSCNATSLDVSNFDTSNVTDMSSMFASCNATSLDVSNFNTSSVTNMNQMFQACTKLTRLDLSSFDTSNVTDMSSMFNYCSALKTIYVNSSKWVVSPGCNTNSMFDGCGCSAVTSI